MFITPNTLIPVTLDGNTIYIKAKMDMNTKSQVQDEITAKGQAEDTELRRIGAYSLSLLTHNIVKWEGPAFVGENGRPIPCDRIHILLLDPNEPLIELVREEIGIRNKPPEKPEDADPN